MTTNMRSEENTLWVTQEAYDRLQEELDHLRGPARQELSARIGEARDEGDLKENGGYHAAKDEQGKQEARIRQLEDMMNRAEVGEQREDDGLVEPGMIVTIHFEGEHGDETFLLGSRELLALDDSVDMDVYSPQSPLGAAISGKRKGDSATYAAPNGTNVTVKVLNAKPFAA
ncbi:MAG: transcription elongation factor GreA [Nocardioidaceae bacterium]|jgi:transcription elongation factor GreA|nr:transcription elongation factor GreA [Nocardioidaceae bacterium]